MEVGKEVGRQENKRELKTIYKLAQCHVYLIYVNLYICIHIYAQRNWGSETYIDELYPLINAKSK